MSRDEIKLVPLAVEQVWAHQLYTEYLSRLASLNKRLKNEEKSLTICMDALAETIRFIDANQFALTDGLSKPLAMLAQALQDLSLGAHPPLFVVSSEKQRKKGPAADLANTRVGAVCAAVFALLRQRRVSVDEAAFFVVIELEKLKLSSSGGGKDVDAKTVINWHKNLPKRQNSEAYKLFNAIFAQLSRELPKETPKAELMRELRGVIRALADSGLGAKIVT